MRPPPDHVEWVRYHCGAALMALVAVTPAAELAHRRLCDYHWQTGLWARTRTGNAAALARVTAAEWDGVAAQLSSLGWRRARGCFFNHEVHRVRAQAVAALRAVRKRARMGAERRWCGVSAQNTASSPGGPPASPLTTSKKRVPGGVQSAIAPSNASSMPQAMPINDKEYDKSTLSDNTAERLPRSGSPLKKGAGAEKDFLDDLRAILGRWNPRAVDPELTNWGGWWRTRYRENPSKARRVLAEVGALVKEGRITKSPGKAGVDLWNRLP